MLDGRASAADTVARMSDELLRQTSDELWGFCEIAEPCPWDDAGAKVRGIEHLREARAALRERGGDVRERLRIAASGLRAAVFHAESWPEALRIAAEALSSKIFRKDDAKPGEAVGRMGPKTAAEICHEILQLCDDADRHHDEEPLRRDPPR